MIPNTALGTRWFHPVVPSNAGTHTLCRQMLCTVLVADVSMKEMPAVMDPGVRRDDPRRGGAQNHDRVFVGTDTVPGAGTGADAGATVTILSNFSSSGLKTNSFSCGVSMAWTQTCRFTPMS